MTRTSTVLYTRDPPKTLTQQQRARGGKIERKTRKGLLCSNNYVGGVTRTELYRKGAAAEREKERERVQGRIDSLPAVKARAHIHSAGLG